METLNLETINLLSGKHARRAEGVCLLEAVAWMAGEPHSDHPACACPVLSAFGRRLNDGMRNDERMALRVFIPKLVSSKRDAGVEKLRAEFLARAACIEILPAVLDLLKDNAEAKAMAEKLRGMKEVSFAELRDTARAACKIAYAADAADYAADAAAADYAADYAAYAADAADYAADAAAADAADYAADAAAADAADYAAAAADYAAAAAAARKVIFDISISMFERACEIGG